MSNFQRGHKTICQVFYAFLLDRVGQIGVLDVDLDDIEQVVVEECLDENCLQYAEI